MTFITETVAWLTDPAHWTGQGAIPLRLLEHVGLSAISLLVAIAIALILTSVSVHAATPVRRTWNGRHPPGRLFSRAFAAWPTPDRSSLA